MNHQHTENRYQYRQWLPQDNPSDSKETAKGPLWSPAEYCMLPEVTTDVHQSHCCLNKINLFEHIAVYQQDTTEHRIREWALEPRVLSLAGEASLWWTKMAAGTTLLAIVRRVWNKWRSAQSHLLLCPPVRLLSVVFVNVKIIWL